MATFIFVCCLLLFTQRVNAFLIDDKTTPSQNVVAAQQYSTLMGLLTAEMKARKHLEEVVTQLNTEVISKTLNITNNLGQTNLIIADLQTKLQNMEIKLEQSVQQHKLENAALHQSVSSLQRVNSIIQRNYSLIQQHYSMLLQNYSTLQVEHDDFKNKFITHANKSAEMATEITAFKTDIQTLKHQVLTLTTNQSARGQDFLALYNQTLEFRSDIASDILNLSSHYNDSVDELFNLLQNGYTGGGSYNDYGATPEPVCLPLDPDFNKTSGGGGDYAIIHGAEFDSNFFASNSAHQDIPCAVCRVKQASSVIMIPGKNRCYTGWNLEYNGYLATNAYNEHGASSYICIDIQPEYVTGGSSWKHDGKLFYEVVAKCGSLHCPPYHNDYPMTCVVCSK
ncbi:Hypothetical predicted protein [Mytilus galloprovincialis]|uniref:Uncharacterized protein n=1 Tax=Mytilus galloprovincialis TaxID=29158 RepID=A0A8B6BLE8_MYTGA|nr:Hypothetical predicted protein [Mytilus galloprovincialis]